MTSLSDYLLALESSGLQRWLWWLAILVNAYERVRVVLGAQVAKSVIDTTVDSLIRTDVEDEITHGSIFLWHLPILDCYVGNLEAGIGPLGKAALVHLLDAASISMDKSQPCTAMLDGFDNTARLATYV